MPKLSRGTYIPATTEETPTMLSDLPTDLHLLILEHDEEKKRLKEENERLKAQVKMTQLILLGPERVGWVRGPKVYEVLPSEMYRYYQTFGIVQLKDHVRSLGLPGYGNSKRVIIKSLIEYYLD